MNNRDNGSNPRSATLHCATVLPPDSEAVLFIALVALMVALAVMVAG